MEAKKALWFACMSEASLQSIGFFAGINLRIAKT